MCRAWSTVGPVTRLELFCILCFYPSQGARSVSWDMGHRTAHRLATSSVPSLRHQQVQSSGSCNHEVWYVGTNVSEEHTSFISRVTDKGNWFHLHGRMRALMLVPTTRLHSVISQETTIWIFTTVKTSYLTPSTIINSDDDYYYYYKFPL